MIMRILHVGKYFYPIEGGIESINKFIVDALEDNEQIVLSFNNSKKNQTDVYHGNVKVIRSSCFGVVFSQPISLSYFWQLKKLLSIFKPDVVHFHYPNVLGAFYLNLLLKPPTKLIIHWHSDIVAQKKFEKFTRVLERRLLKKASKIIVTSPEYGESSGCLHNFRDKLSVIPCSINEMDFQLTVEEKIEVEDIKKRYHEKPIVFFVGRHVEYKGLGYLLEAEKLIKSDCVLIIAGRGPLTEKLKNACQSKRIYWIGRLSDHDLKLYYHAATVLAFPSITRNEAFGVVLAESMCCGTPAVTFTIAGSGVNWVSLNGISCIEVENKNIIAYAEALDKLLSDPNLRDKLAQGGKKRVLDLFSKGKITEAYRNLYNTLI